MKKVLVSLTIIITVTIMIYPNKAKGRNNNTRGRSYPGSSYGSSSNSPVIQMGRMSLINSKVSQNGASPSIHLEDISENSLLYAQLHEYLAQKQSILLH
ncbi:hypothetical protein H5410_032229 [Solanum commersonii]|uniref:Uncharacterized protein n=1 Tax=Solanum commersonii TaxID=4109 RepID=A0A9J5YJD6_SOLCO|nr:hypothetical protein H5410_032229 [Solanum commersonii]